MANEYLFIVIGMGVVTYIPRWLPLYFLTKQELPKWFIEWLEMIPASILSAILLPALITAGDPRHLDIMRNEMWVAIPTFIFAKLTKSLGGTVFVGMALFWIAEKFI